MIGQRAPKLTVSQEREAYEAVNVRDGGRCVACGHYDPDAMHRDHRQNRTAYNTTPANLQLLGGPAACGHHQYFTERPGLAIESGFAVSRYSDPATTPAWRFDAGWVTYLDVPDEHGNWWLPATDPNN